MLAVAAVFVVLATITNRQASATPLMGECSTSAHCGGETTCCLVGFDRYSSPRCAPRGNIGDWCRIEGTPRHMVLPYPNGIVVEVEEAYHGMCPCLPGLVCSRISSTCQLPEAASDEENSLNSIL